MRNKVIKDTQILRLIDFGNFKIFEAGIQTMVMMFKKSAELNSYSFDYRRLLGSDLKLEDTVVLLNRERSAKAEYISPKIERSQFIDKSLTFSTFDIQHILEKISSQSNFRLDPSKEVAQGIVPNPDVVGTSNLKKIPKHKITKYGIKKGDGVFVVQKGFFKKLNVYEKKVLKPLLEPGDLIRYFIKKPSSKNIIYITKANDDKKTPNLLDHLEKFREIMNERRENKNGRLNYYHLHWPRDEYFFEPGPKILSVRKCIRPTFAYTEESAYVMMSINVIRSTRLDAKYLTGLLNSRLIAFWLKHKGKMQGTNYQIDKDPLVNLPLINPDQDSQQTIATIVDKILVISKNNNYLENVTKQKQVREYEKRIDQLTYKLYNLTSDEVKVIEIQGKK